MVVNYVRDEAEARRVVDEIATNGVRVLATQVDVSREEDLKRMFARMIEELGTIDIP